MDIPFISNFGLSGCICTGGKQLRPANKSQGILLF